MENIINILTNEFRPRFCLEDLRVLAHGLEPVNHLDIAIPMVCFCDLPLSSTADHLSVYGNYGIGLSKEWAMRAGITPVLYTYANSSVAGTFAALVAKLNDPERRQLSTSMLDDIYDFSCFVKPYEGDFWREGKVLSGVRFYDEREWRFVPKLPQNFYRYGLTKERFLDENVRQHANQKLSNLVTLHFEPNDIRYIVVEREAEILEMMESIERIKRKYSYDEVRTLMSRIISAEQIRQDF